MIIEFTGCTGSGKSSLAEKVYNRLKAGGKDVVFRFEFVMGPVLARAVTAQRARNIILDFVAFPYFLVFLVRYRSFAAFAVKTLFRKPDSVFGTVNRLRSIIRKMGLYVLLRRRRYSDRIIIVDEGLMHSAHNIFVYNSLPLSERDIAKFSRLVPPPDKVIFVSGPADYILNRTLKRRDPPIKTSAQALANYINRAIEVFKLLEKTAKKNGNSVNIYISGEGDNALDEAAERAIDFILKSDNENAR